MTYFLVWVFHGLLNHIYRFVIVIPTNNIFWSYKNTFKTNKDFVFQFMKESMDKVNVFVQELVKFDNIN